LGQRNIKRVISNRVIIRKRVRERRIHELFP